MQDRIKNVVVTVGFAIILIFVFLINIINGDKLISTTERRKLAQFPEINMNNIKSGEVAKKFDKYTVDQFVARDFFREIKSFVSINLLRQKDNNNLFEKNGSIYKMDYPLNKGKLKNSLDKINNVYNNYLQNMNVYYAIIPDKNYYLENDDHLKIDYNELLEISQNALRDMKYIDIWDCLSENDYYRTDLHWKQENLSKVVEKIQNDMKKTDTSKTDYKINDNGDFFGVYFGQLGIKVEADKLYTLSNNIIDSCRVYNYETGEMGTIYTNPKRSDKYDTYLYGATPLITIENPNADTDKELLLFRDSFGSSIAPLLIENYKKVTLIDLRYISSSLLEEYISFDNQDVLFLYSTLVLNQNILK